jgi:REP element-mobilizing transposase RayT
MSRKARIDAADALHHVIVRGIENRAIFEDDYDRNDFLERLGQIVLQTHTRCFAWALMPDHFHLLLKTDGSSISTVMSRLLTGYAVRFNRRHKRNGHLFQNRYRSILCQADAYLLELVRYIHLNPIRAKIVSTLQALDRYRFSGHSVIMGKHRQDWQSVDRVLGSFDGEISRARRQYREYVGAGINQGRRPELIGGGLVRSSGGWAAVRLLRKSGTVLRSDERILGDSNFVKEVLEKAGESLSAKYALAMRGIDFEKLVCLVSELWAIEPEKIIGAGKLRRAVKARSLLCYWAVHELGWTMTQLAEKIKIAVPTVSVAVVRGRKIATENNLSLSVFLDVKG